MKKIVSLVLILVLSLSLFACGKTAYTPDAEGKISVVATVFPVYDWLRNVIGDVEGISLKLLLDSGVDLHNFQASAEDISLVASADLFVYIGGASDHWVPDALKQAEDGQVAVNLMEELGDAVKEEEVVGSMEEEEEGEESGEEGPEYDEHIWLSLKNAEVLVDVLAAALGRVDPVNGASYSKNAAAYMLKLAELDEKYTEATANAKTKTLVFGDRFPFRYLTDDYGLQYDAAFVGCSAETEASFQTIDALANTVDSLGLKYIFAIEGRDHALAETIVRNTAAGDQQILILNSLQGVTPEDLQNGVTYLSVMEKNLEIMLPALQ